MSSPMSTEVIELILTDHRRFEDLFRGLRDRTSDRPALLRELAGVLVAHAVAEEQEVYPALERFKKVDNDEVEHGAEEHAEGHQALLALLEVSSDAAVGSDEWEGKLEELVETVNHHLDEEERTILNDARDAVPDTRRIELGEAFSAVRAEQLDSGCGEIDNVRRLAKETEGRID